jgi:hypothetical protein
MQLKLSTMEGILPGLKQAGSDIIFHLQEQIESLTKELKEKVDEMEYLETLNRTLMVKEHRSNHELQEARKELINVRIFYICFASCIFLYTICLASPPP